MTIYPAPKPTPALPKRKAFGSTLPAPDEPINAFNPERRAEEFKRCYESEERVMWIRSLPCVVSGRRPTVNAHVRGGGAGRKADARYIVPLTKPLHDELHKIGVESFESNYSIDLEATAARIEDLWQAKKKEGA